MTEDSDAFDQTTPGVARDRCAPGGAGQLAGAPAACLDVSRVLTEPLKVYELADLFGLERHLMCRWLREIPGATRLGGFWRVPITQMPPAYLLSKGLLAPAAVPQRVQR
jgi:hypothetical protein